MVVVCVHRPDALFSHCTEPKRMENQVVTGQLLLATMIDTFPVRVVSGFDISVCLY